MKKDEILCIEGIIESRCLVAVLKRVIPNCDSSIKHS